MSVLVREVKWNAVGHRSPEQHERWFRFVAHAEDAGRATAMPDTSTVIGNDWLVECEDRAHAEWFCSWLKDMCGFTDTMLVIRR